jgi:molecular chaperone GrpE (heat shock protein)
MNQRPLAEQSAKLLAALDWSAEAAAQKQRHRRELTAILQSLLDLMDAFDRLLAEHGAAGEERGDGRAVPRSTVRLLARQLEGCLLAAGVVALPCLGEAADPDVHEIAGVGQGETAGKGTIVEIVSGGYLWNGELLRRPRVIVAAGSEEDRP